LHLTASCVTFKLTEGTTQLKLSTMRRRLCQGIMVEHIEILQRNQEKAPILHNSQLSN